MSRTASCGVIRAPRSARTLIGLPGSGSAPAGTSSGSGVVSSSALTPVTLDDDRVAPVLRGPHDPDPWLMTGAPLRRRDRVLAGAPPAILRRHLKEGARGGTLGSPPRTSGAAA